MTTEFKILRNLDGKHGSDYMEILPGEFKNNCWNPESIFFREEAFEIVETIIRARVPSLDHYENTSIDSVTCWEIIRDLDRFAGVLSPGATTASLKQLPVFERQSAFLKTLRRTPRHCGRWFGNWRHGFVKSWNLSVPSPSSGCRRESAC